MSDSGSQTLLLMKMVGVIGVLALISTLLYPADNPPPFDNLTTQPSFSNPFASHSFVRPVEAAETNITYWGGAGGVIHHWDTFGCSNATYWECLESDDMNTSYVILKSSGYFVNVNQTGLDNPGQILAVTLTVSCRITGSARLVIAHANGLFEDRALPQCATGHFSSVTINFQGIESYAWDALIGCTAGASLCDDLNTNVIGVTAGPGTVLAAGSEIDVSYLRVDFHLTQAPEACKTGGGFFGSFDALACQVSRFFDVISKGIQFAFNGLIWVASWLVYIGTFVADIALVVGWWYHVPGMPAEVQAVVDIFMTVLLIGTFFIMASLIRGNE